jgi:hypothetical protein
VAVDYFYPATSRCSRGATWSIFHPARTEDRLEDLLKLFSFAEQQFPTRIDRTAAADAIGPESLRWFVDHNILAIADSQDYSLVDEFLRVRIILDSEQERENRAKLESDILSSVDFHDLSDENEEVVEP